MLNSFKNELKQEHNGAVALEYIIILVIMVVALFVGLGGIAGVFKSKSSQVSDFIGKNGQSALAGN